MRFLIAVKSCAYDHQRGAHNLIRSTWGQEVNRAGADLLFFTAANYNTGSIDEVSVNSPDDYAGLPLKTREIAKYTIRKNYDYALFCDTGSLVIPHHLMAYDFDKFDYMGYWGLKKDPIVFNMGDRRKGCRPQFIQKCYPWASGGGYILSRRAIEIVATSEPVVWAEDCSVAQVLASAGIFLEDRAEEGFKGFVVDWIHDEDNAAPNAMMERQKWMEKQYGAAKKRCIISGCDIRNWNLKGQVRTPEAEVEAELRKKHEERKKEKQ